VVSSKDGGAAVGDVQGGMALIPCCAMPFGFSSHAKSFTASFQPGAPSSMERSTTARPERRAKMRFQPQALGCTSPGSMAQTTRLGKRIDSVKEATQMSPKVPSSTRSMKARVRSTTAQLLACTACAIMWASSELERCRSKAPAIMDCWQTLRPQALRPLLTAAARTPLQPSRVRPSSGA